MNWKRVSDVSLTIKRGIIRIDLEKKENRIKGGKRLRPTKHSWRDKNRSRGAASEVRMIVKDGVVQ